jgi:methylthioribose-1-phosphate isomerase
MTPFSLKSLVYDASSSPPTLKVLDQLKLPDESEYVEVRNLRATWSVITNMQIRGNNTEKRTLQA